MSALLEPMIYQLLVSWDYKAKIYQWGKGAPFCVCLSPLMDMIKVLGSPDDIDKGSSPFYVFILVNLVYYIVYTFKCTL